MLLSLRSFVNAETNPECCVITYCSGEGHLLTTHTSPCTWPSGCHRVAHLLWPPFLHLVNLIDSALALNCPARMYSGACWCVSSGLRRDEVVYYNVLPLVLRLVQNSFSLSQLLLPLLFIDFIQVYPSDWYICKVLHQFAQCLTDCALKTCARGRITFDRSKVCQWVNKMFNASCVCSQTSVTAEHKSASPSDIWLSDWWLKWATSEEINKCLGIKKKTRQVCMDCGFWQLSHLLRGGAVQSQIIVSIHVVWVH